MRRAGDGVQVFNEELSHTYIYLDYVRVEFLFCIKIKIEIKKKLKKRKKEKKRVYWLTTRNW